MRTVTGICSVCSATHWLSLDLNLFTVVLVTVSVLSLFQLSNTPI